MVGALGLALILGGALMCLAILGGVRMPWEGSAGAVGKGVAGVPGVWPPTTVTPATTG